MSKPISANFSGVESGAQQIIKRAEGISQDLEAFHKKVEEYVAVYGAGAANDAFSEMQRNWAKQAESLQTTLNGAAQLVSTGNSELQSTDSALANLF
ncbi:WXG100 family type VII secretion target [Nocardia sp. NBC_01377]|uniref:WXG100 family type VII secretion target n=1 Tax=Nocardia TaxID=1817 RepID=UPI001C21E135|nr:WXG100 family type VII secretion target [Nocardia noduli]